MEEEMMEAKATVEPSEGKACALATCKYLMFSLIDIITI
jgi:hypothetical protein